MSFSFGTPPSAPATTGLTGGFSFGANKPSTTGFGLTPATQATGLFGAPATSAPAFGTATGTAPAFGTTPAFGAAAPTFGANTSFGATTNAPAFGATTSLSFGVSSAPSFGAPTPAFGATTTPAFGANTSFGTGGLGFGTGASTAASTGLSFGTTTTTSTGLGGLGGFGFGASTQANWSLGSTATTTASAFGNPLGATNVTGTQLSTAAAPSLGLGGVATSGITNTTSTDGKTIVFTVRRDGGVTPPGGDTSISSYREPPMQQKLPNEISTTVESFKEFVKKQKTLSSDIMRISIKPLHKVSQEAESTLRAVAALRGECGRARAHAKRLRATAAAALAAAETAARDAPGTDLEGPTPPHYVSELISELEQQLTTFRRQMDVADKQMQSSPKLPTERELSLGIRRMHGSLVSLAARLQAQHALVAAQKEQYLNLRKYILKDPTDVFDAEAPNASLDRILQDVEGTRGKKSLSDVVLGSSMPSDPRAISGNIQQLAGPTPFTYLGNSISSLPATDNTASNWQPQPQTSSNTSLNLSFGATHNDSGFQLQKPPGKRGKQ